MADRLPVPDVSMPEQDPIDVGFWPSVVGPPPSTQERKYLPEKSALMDADIADDMRTLEQALAAATDPSWKVEHPDEYNAVLSYLNSPDRSEAYRGMARCRVCHGFNGNADNFKGPFRYPSGYVHYLTDHGFKPPQVVIDAALQA